jgi:hypothetical protein
MARRNSTQSLRKGAANPDIGICFDSFGEFVAHCDKLPNSSRLNDGRMFDSKWQDGLDFNQAVDKARTGDLARVQASDKIMSKLEDLVAFNTSQMQTVDAMTGGIPNVAAYLAGSPMNMRRRQRVALQAAPLNVIVDLGSSSGISAEQLARRGATILAFVRIMSAQRPVNLYLATAFSPYSARESTAAGVAVRVDTSPLDLARASYAISGAAFPRHMMYSALIHETKCSNHDSLPFPYSDIEFYRRNLHKFWERFVSVDTEETAVIGPLYLTDDFADPEKWLREMVAKYAQEAV